MYVRIDKVILAHHGGDPHNTPTNTAAVMRPWEIDDLEYVVLPPV